MYWTSNDRSSFDAPDDAFWVGLNSSYIWLGAYDNIRQTFKSKYEGMAVRLLKDEFLVTKQIQILLKKKTNKDLDTITDIFRNLNFI